MIASPALKMSGVAAVSLSTAIPMSNDSAGAETVVPEGYSFPPGKDSATVFMFIAPLLLKRTGQQQPPESPCSCDSSTYPPPTD